MISKMFLRKGLYVRSLELLWQNVNLLSMECRVRMNEFMKAEDCDSPKMVKWAKYFIVNLLQMITAYSHMNQLPNVYECCQMLEWLASTFLSKNSLFYMNLILYIKKIRSDFDYFLNEWKEHIGIIERLAIDIIGPIDLHEIDLNEEDSNKKKNKKCEDKGYGFIPKESKAQRLIATNLDDVWFRHNEKPDPVAEESSGEEQENDLFGEDLENYLSPKSSKRNLFNSNRPSKRASLMKSGKKDKNWKVIDFSKNLSKDSTRISGSYRKLGV